MKSCANEIDLKVILRWNCTGYILRDFCCTLNLILHDIYFRNELLVIIFLMYL